MDSYKMVEKHRERKREGGVAIFVKDRQCFKEREDLSIFDDDCESVFIEIDKSNSGFQKDVVICVIYRPPNTDVKVFNELITTIIDKINKEKTLLFHGRLQHRFIKNMIHIHIPMIFKHHVQQQLHSCDN